MRVPIRHLTENLIWSTTGTVWSVWRVPPVSYRHASTRTKIDVHGATTALFKRLKGDVVVLSLCGQVSAVSVVEKMIRGIEIDNYPGWAEIANTAGTWLDSLELTERSHWLIIPLSANRNIMAMRSVADSALSSVTDALGLAPPAVTAADLETYLSMSVQLGKQLAWDPPIRPANPAEIMWIYRHSLQRGITDMTPEELGYESSGARLINGLLRGPGFTSLGQARLAEGGQPGDVRPWWRGGKSPLRRRWLQVETEAGTAYQAFLAMAEMPAMYHFPGSEFLADLDRFDFGIDYASRLKIVSNTEAEAKSRRQARELNSQVDEYDGDSSGVPQALISAAGDLDDERARLQSSSTEVEVQSATTICVWGGTPEECDTRADLVRNAFAAGQYQLVRPAGGQRALFHAMLPGAPVPTVLREFTQYQLASDYSMAMPWTSTDVGDPTGMLLGMSLDGGTARPVLLDLANVPKQDASASIGAVGELGAGKSVLLKTIQIGLLDRGSRVIAVDRTPMGEWAHFAESAAPDRHQIIRADAYAKLTLDPLRVFPSATAARYAKSYLSLQLNVAPMSPAGLVLAQAVEAVAAGDRPHMRMVIDQLALMAEREKETRRGENAGELADLLRVVAADPLSQMVFGDLPPLRMDGDFVVFHTAGLSLPKKEVFTSEYHMSRQPLESLIGRAVLYLIAAISREVAFSDTSRFVGVSFDECYWLTNSIEGQDLVLEIVRDGRKHSAGALLGSHDPDDFGNETIRGLLSNKFLLRQRDSRLAAKGLDFLNIGSRDQEMIDLVTTDLSPVTDPARKGECLFLDTRRRIGQVKILIPPVKRIVNSILTTPTSPAAVTDAPTAANMLPARSQPGTP